MRFDALLLRTCRRHFLLAVGIFVVLVRSTANAEMRTTARFASSADEHLDDGVDDGSKIPVNILLLLPRNDTYKFSLAKVLLTLSMARQDISRTEMGARFDIDIMPDTCDCTSIEAPLNAMENIYRKRNHTKRFHAVFGPMCDYSLAPVARYAPFWDVAVITVGAMAQDFRKNKFSEYKTLTNIGPTMYWLDKFVTKVFDHFNWKQVIFLFDKDYQEQITNFNCYLTMASLKAALLNSKVTVDYKIRDKQDPRPVETILMDYVGIKFSVILLCGSTNFVNDIMVAAHKLGFINGEYVFVNFDLYASMHSEDRLLKPWKATHRHQVASAALAASQPNQTSPTKVHGQTADQLHDQRQSQPGVAVNNSMDQLVEPYQGLLTVTLKNYDSYRDYRMFQEKLVRFDNKMFRNESDANYFLASFYDAINIYVSALNKTVSESKRRDINDIPAVLRHIWGKKFKGVTGDIVIDNFGERMGEFTMFDYNPATHQFESVISSTINGTDVVLEYDKPGRDIYWHHFETGQLPDSPTCGFNRAKCPVDEPLPIWYWLLIAMGVIMIVMLAIGIVFYRKAKFETELNAMNWLIKWEDVSASMQTSNEEKGQNAKRKEYLLNNKVDDNLTLASVDLKTNNAKAVVYKRSWCFIKKLNKTKIEINRQLLLEVKKIKDLQNDHITRFIGICLEPNRQFIFSEYAQKGSLQDLLENQEIELEPSFKHHLIHDIIKGMIFIQNSEIKYHGNLTSTNCVVDSRFTLKITDFGLPMLYSSPCLTEEDYYKKQMWKAPELQSPYGMSGNSSSSNNNTPAVSHSVAQKGDVYSFAVIVQEIFCRKGVFYLTDEDKQIYFHINSSPPVNTYEDYMAEISYKIIFGRIKTGLRPSLDNDMCCREITDLLRKCWSDNVSERPDFSTIRDIMRKTYKISGNILDNLLARMEKYANNLEELVKERTEACDNERKRAEELLYRLLPSTVASQLMLGNEVKAESFDSVTIYFSDICGFTNLSANSTPMQVVHLLNGLYTLFDSIIESFDVYKVETIGDAYMVVSGLPQRNQDHSREIARMSLALLENVEHFRIPHLPNVKLELRIGLHSGPCVAGVVGLKMPRYCLFGDTVNTASRMESNGKALRIHISPQTNEALAKYGTFDIKLRGPVEMKGKGVITTYWLLGEHGRIIDKHTDEQNSS